MLAQVWSESYGQRDRQILGKEELVNLVSPMHSVVDLLIHECILVESIIVQCLLADSPDI